MCFAVIAVLCGGSVSCKSQPEERAATNATLEGTVTYNGQPVPHALIIVAGTDSRTADADASGRFKVNQVSLGKVTIGVNTAAAKGRIMGQLMAKKQKGPTGASAQAVGGTPELVEIPEKYHSPQTSGIETVIKEGANTLDIKLP